MIRFALLVTGIAFGQECDSIAAASYGGWKPVSTAPRDGTVVEMMQTYGVAPTYGLYKWTRELMVLELVFGQRSPQPKPYKMKTPAWVSADNSGSYFDSSRCLFWRPYKGDVAKYVDPTGGAQNKVAYWCAAMHVAYDPKKDRCVKR